MRPLKVKVKVIEEYNDSKNNGKLVEEGTIIELDYGRYEFLRSIGKVEEYKESRVDFYKKENDKSNN